VIALCACMNPVDVQTFLDNEEVGELIETTKVAVKVSSDSDAGLKGGNGIISGLDPNKYYMVTKELDDKDTPVNPTPPYPRFVTEQSTLTKGQLIDDLGYITRIAGRTITTLTNKHTYTVISAKSILSGTLPYNDSSGTSLKTITDGVLTIGSINGTGTLDLSTVLTGGTYEVMAVSVNAPTTSPWSWVSRTKTATNLTSFEVEKSGTVDYVFYKSAAPIEFKVLRVVAPATINIKAIPGVTKPVTGATPVSAITETAEYTGAVTWSPAHTTFAAVTPYTATITLTPKTGYTLIGVPENFFTVAEATSVTYTAGSNTVVAVFPPTGAATTVTITITFAVSDASITNSVSGNVTSPITYANILGGETILTFNLGGGTFTGVTWVMDGVTASGGSNTGLTIGSTSNLLQYLVTGTHVLYVKGKKGGQDYSETITFTVN